MQANRSWILYSLITTLMWGVWLAFVDFPVRNGLPETLGYIVWSLTMIPPALIAIGSIGWRVDYDWRSIVLGMAAGLLGAGGQLVLFKTLRIAPAYLVSPLIALSPLVTIVLVALISGERAGGKAWSGISLALIAGVLLSYSPPDGASGQFLWIGLTLLVLFAWGAQGFVISYANKTMSAESIFFYMMLSAVLLAPIAWWMTSFEQDINTGFSGLGLSAAVQTLNSIGALMLVYAYRYGKAIIVTPLINAGAPVITIVLSLFLAGRFPIPAHAVGMILAIVAIVLMTLGENEPQLAMEV
jgi:drug/metabolite transporter (DMT)-like permease